MKFEFAASARILFGAGSLGEAAPTALALGQHALLVVGKSASRAMKLADELMSRGMQVSFFNIPGEPTINLAESGAQTARQVGCDLLIGFGGGSVLDAAKAIAALATNPGEALDYLEVIGRAQPLKNPPLPVIAIPTTAGTGSEVTRNAVLASPEKHVKVSLRHPLMLPRLAIVDPELTYNLPPDVTAATGLDALTQLIEPFTSNAANPLTDALCLEGIARAARSLRKAYQQGNDAQAREDMALASLFGGMALANAKLGAVHGFAGPLGGMFPAPHGQVCARLLPYVMQANLRALRERQPDSATLGRYTRLGQVLCNDEKARAEDGIAWVEATCQELNIPPLRAHGVSEAQLPAVVEQAMRASSMKGNPIELREEELMKVITSAL